MHPTLNLTKPQNQRSPDDNAHPVTERQGNHTEHLATEGDDEHLTNSDDQYSNAKTTSYVLVEQALKRRVHGVIGLGVEDVPELHEHENGKEQGQLFWCEIAAHMMEIEIACKIVSKRKLR